MNPYGDTNLNSGSESPPSYSLSNPYDHSHTPSVFSVLSIPVIHTHRSSVTVLSYNPRPSVDFNADQNIFQTQNSGHSTSALPLPAPDFSHGSGSASLTFIPTSNPYPAPATPPPPSGQISIMIPSPDLLPSPLSPSSPSASVSPQPRCSKDEEEDGCPDLECAICFSQFNNVFRCPKQLQCRHTFCLECLARINVKSPQPSAIQCPLCRGLTPLPALGLPRLATDPRVLSCLPAAMQRVYSIRFVRDMGKLQVKRSSEGRHRSLVSLRSTNRSLDVGLPTPAGRGEVLEGGHGGVGGALFRLTARPVCRAFLLTSAVMMLLLLTAIVIFLLIYNNKEDSG